jgi:hypothetical protein
MFSLVVGFRKLYPTYVLSKKTLGWVKKSGFNASRSPCRFWTSNPTSILKSSCLHPAFLRVSAFSQAVTLFEAQNAGQALNLHCLLKPQRRIRLFSRILSAPARSAI